jgi:DNA polymerase
VSDPLNMRAALLDRLRYEQMMGLECLHPVALEKNSAPPAPAVSSSEPARQALQRNATPSAPPPRPAPAAAIAIPEEASADTPIDERWLLLEQRANACTACARHAGRTHVVFGRGGKTARVMFVGEAPGAAEDQSGQPFSGPSGELLEKIIAAMKLTPDDVYLCNAVKCHPQALQPLLPDELRACQPLLAGQIELIAPAVIVALGTTACKTLFNTSEKIDTLRGRWFSHRNIPVMPTYHPAFLRKYHTAENRRDVWDDMQKVVRKLAEG